MLLNNTCIVSYYVLLAFEGVGKDDSCMWSLPSNYCECLQSSCCGSLPYWRFQSGIQNVLLYFRLRYRKMNSLLSLLLERDESKGEGVRFSACTIEK